ncbi:MAG: zf-HC2 domain-containing protein [Candidatus Acidiferrales bacterium]
MSYKVNCERISPDMIPYLDGRATVQEQRIVEAHAALCPDCRRRVEEFRTLLGVLDEMPVLLPSGAFDARLRARVAEEPPASWFSWLTPAPRIAFALALLLALFVWIGKFQPPADMSANALQSEQDYHAIKDLDVLENYDVLKSFDALSELPVAVPQKPAPAKPDSDRDKDGHI